MTSPTELASKPSWIQTITIGRRPRYTLIRLVVLVIATVVVFHFVLLPIRVSGISMLPTYHDRSVNFVNRLAYWHHGPQRGDVISVGLAGYHLMFMKRVIALPGETVEFKDGHVYINGDLLDEPYEKTACDWNVPAVQLAPDEYYVVGDNRTMPAIDHVFGVAKRSRIVGKVML